jgi:prepilin-type N-terminal cleavage/methylation domain-containing protein
VRLARSARSAARRGFSLVEVLVVLLIVGGLMLALTQLLEAARISRDTIHNLQETQLAGPAIMDSIEHDLRSMLTYDRRPEELLQIRNRTIYGLDGDSIDFVTTTNSKVMIQVDRRLVRSDTNEVGYRLRPNPTAADQFLEIYRREAFGVDEDPFEDGRFMFLHDRVKSFDVQCFAKDGRDEQPIDEWGGEREPENIGLPARIEITLVLELAPRVVNEQLLILPNDRRTLTYQRVIRFPEGLRGKEEDIPVPKIPQTPQATGPSTTTGGGAGKPTLTDEGVKGGGGGGGGGGGASGGAGAGRKDDILPGG